MKNNNAPKRGLAVLLALFLGGFGVHQFYLDRPGKGIMYLIGTITVIGAPVVGIICLVDAIRYCSMDDSKWNSFVK